MGILRGVQENQRFNGERLAASGARFASEKMEFE